MNIFETADLVGFTIENTVNNNFMITGRLIAGGTTATTDELGIDFCAFKQEYQKDALIRSWFDDELLIATPITLAGRGIVCAFESGGITKSTTPPVSPANLDTWLRTTDMRLFVFNETVGKWLSDTVSGFVASKPSATAQNTSLEVAGIATNITPIRVPYACMITGLIMQAGDVAEWSVLLRDYTSLSVYNGTLKTTTTQSTVFDDLDAIIAAGVELDMYIQSDDPVPYPIVTYLLKEVVNG